MNKHEILFNSYQKFLIQQKQVFTYDANFLIRYNQVFISPKLSGWMKSSDFISHPSVLGQQRIVGSGVPFPEGEIKITADVLEK